MEQPRRLFDVIEHQLKYFPKSDMLVGKENNVWKKYSTQEVADLTLRFSAGLLQLGIGNGDASPEGSDKIAIVSPNRPEWVITDLACQQAGAVLAPLYPTLSDHELEFILNDSGAAILFISGQDMLDKIQPCVINYPI